MNFFAALTCTIFAWGLAEGHKVFLRNFQSGRVFSHRTRRTHSNDRFGTNIRGCSGLRCTSRAILCQELPSLGGAAVSAAPTEQSCVRSLLLGGEYIKTDLSVCAASQLTTNRQIRFLFLYNYSRLFSCLHFPNDVSLQRVAQ